MAESTDPPLLGEELLVGHGVDGMREGEGRAAQSKQKPNVKFKFTLVLLMLLVFFGISQD